MKQVLIDFDLYEKEKDQTYSFGKQEAYKDMIAVLSTVQSDPYLMCSFLEGLYEESTSPKFKSNVRAVALILKPYFNSYLNEELRKDSENKDKV